MKIDIVVSNDENFTMNDVRLNGTLTVENAVVENPVENVFVPKPVLIPVPVENFRQTNSFDLFAGTSWAGKPNSFN